MEKEDSVKADKEDNWQDKKLESRMRKKETRSTRVASMQVTTITVNLKQQGISKVGSEALAQSCIVHVPEVAEEGEGDDGDGDETKGEVPPQLH